LDTLSNEFPSYLTENEKKRKHQKPNKRLAPLKKPFATDVKTEGKKMED